MNRKHASELYASLSDASITSNSNDFEVLSLRVSHSTSAVIHAITAAFPRPVLTMFTDPISEHLASHLIQSAQNESLIREELKNGIQPDSALDLLRADGAIQFDDSMIKKLLKLEEKK